VTVSTVNKSGYLYRLWKYTSVGGETTLSGNDDSGNTLSYNVGTQLVFLNGVLLVSGVDYTATTGTSITGLTALVAGDVATVISIVTQVLSGYVASNNFTSAGQLLVGTGSSTFTAQAIGVQYQQLVPDSTQTDGLRWGDDNNILTIMGAYL